MNIDELGLVIRIAAAVVWTMLTARTMRAHRLHGHHLRRAVILGTTTLVLWGLVIRGATIVGLVSGEWTTAAITASVFLAFMSGASLLTTQPDP